MPPLTIGFVIMGPLSGIFSDKYGGRRRNTIGMGLVGVSFLILAVLPDNFDYLPFAIALLIMGLGNGMFKFTECTRYHELGPPEERGVTSGMMSTLMISGFVLRMGCSSRSSYFGLTRKFPHAVLGCPTSAGAAQLVPTMSTISPSGALFAAFLGYNPVQMILTGLSPALAPAGIAPVTLAKLTGGDLVPDDACTGIHALACPFVLYRGRDSFVAALLCLCGGRNTCRKSMGQTRMVRSKRTATGIGRADKEGFNMSPGIGVK